MSVKDLAFETLRVTVDDMLLTVTLDDTGIPLNLFTWQRMEELGELMSRLRDETAVRAIVLTGSGRYLSGGGSFDLFATLDTSESAERMRRASRKLYKDMLEVGQPIVCAVNGPAIGAGCSLDPRADACGRFALEMLDFRSRDHREAIAAFKEGRPPVFTGS